MMDYNTKYPRDTKMPNNKVASMSYVRVLHAVPDAPNVDVYANDKLIASNLAYGEYTDYMPINPGPYEISLYKAGSDDMPVLMNIFNMPMNSIYTIAAVGTLSDLGFLAIVDSNMKSDPRKAMIRFAHLSPNAPAVDITLPNGTVLFGNVSYKQLTSYLSVDPMNYTLQVRLAGTPTVVLTVPNVILEANKFYTVYAIGLVGKSPELEALLITDK